MNEPTVFQRLLNSQAALRATIAKILDLNRQLKSIRASKQAPENLEIKQELKLLNKVADHQAKIVHMYQATLQKVSNQ